MIPYVCTSILIGFKSTSSLCILHCQQRYTTDWVESCAHILERIVAELQTSVKNSEERCTTSQLPPMILLTMQCDQGDNWLRCMWYPYYHMDLWYVNILLISLADLYLMYRRVSWEPLTNQILYSSMNLPKLASQRLQTVENFVLGMTGHMKGLMNGYTIHYQYLSNI